jgi:beta-phosphoglucomutase
LKPKALIFDMDGVLVDSEPLYERAKREAFRKAGIVLPEERFATLIGRGDEAMLKDLASDFSLSAEQSAEILRQKNEFYESSESTLRPIPGALDFVHWSHRHFRLALATSASPRYRHFLMTKFDIESLFEVVVDAALVKAPKPSPEVFEITLKKLSLEPTTCWIIEDSINGLVAAKQAGCFAVGITTSFSSQILRSTGADLVVQSFTQLKSHLAES